MKKELTQEQCAFLDKYFSTGCTEARSSLLSQITHYFVPLANKYKTFLEFSDRQEVDQELWVALAAGLKRFCSKPRPFQQCLTFLYFEVRNHLRDYSVRKRLSVTISKGGNYARAFCAVEKLYETLPMQEVIDIVSRKFSREKSVVRALYDLVAGRCVSEEWIDAHKSTHFDDAFVLEQGLSWLASLSEDEQYAVHFNTAATRNKTINSKIKDFKESLLGCAYE